MLYSNYGRAQGGEIHRRGVTEQADNVEQGNIPAQADGLKENTILEQAVESTEMETSVNNNNQSKVPKEGDNQSGDQKERNTPKEQQFCKRCGKVGHTGNSCLNPVICSRCKSEGHVARVCETKMPWDFISPFCGFSAYGQGFHVIESEKSEEGIKDMSTTALVTITSGQASARELENEFRLKAGKNSTWRWYAKRIGEGKYQLRFPNSQALEDISYFTELRMRSLPNVVFKVEKWNPAAGSKGKLDTAWFRISNIPFEKRSYSNVCMIASKVGLPLEVDKENLNKNDFVRVKIGCRDVTKVPASVDGLLDFHFYDYYFQREVPQDGFTNPAGNKWIRNERDPPKDDIPSPKKMRMEQKEGQTSGTDNIQSAGNSNKGDSTGKQAAKGPEQQDTLKPTCSEESEEDAFVTGDLIVPGSEQLRFGDFDPLIIGKVSCITVDVNPKAVLNEYGSNFIKYKQDPLVSIEAKQAIQEGNSGKFFQVEDFLVNTVTTQPLPSIMEEQEKEELDVRPTSLSPFKGSQSAPEVIWSSQEEGSNQDKELQMAINLSKELGNDTAGDKERKGLNVDSQDKEIKMVTELSKEEGNTTIKEFSSGLNLENQLEEHVMNEQETMVAIPLQADWVIQDSAAPHSAATEKETNQDGWPEWQEVRQSKRIREMDTSQLMGGIQDQSKKGKIIEEEGLLKEEMKQQLIQGAEAMKTAALHFHAQDQEKAQLSNQLVPLAG